MSKKFFIFFIVILLLSSCSKQIQTNIDEKITNEAQDIKEQDNINKDDAQAKKIPLMKKNLNMKNLDTLVSL